MDLKFSISNDSIILKILRNFDEIPLFPFKDNKDLNLRYDSESHFNSSFCENHNVVHVSQIQTLTFHNLL